MTRLPASRQLPPAAFWIGARWREAVGPAKGRVVSIVGGAGDPDRVMVLTVVALTQNARARAGKQRPIAKSRLRERFDLVLEGSFPLLGDT